MTQPPVTEAFAALQAKLGPALAANSPGSGVDHVMIALPSYSVSESLMSHYGDRIAALEHRYLNAVAVAGRIETCEIVYISTRAPLPEVVRYYLDLVPEDRRAGLDERLARAARRHEPLALRTAGGGRFGDRVLWAGAEGDVRALSALADTVRAAARRAGTPADEEHAFRAHLTLARTRKHATVDLRPHAAALATHRGPQ